MCDLVESFSSLGRPFESSVLSGEFREDSRDLSVSFEKLSVEVDVSEECSDVLDVVRRWIIPDGFYFVFLHSDDYWFGSISEVVDFLYVEKAFL